MKYLTWKLDWDGNYGTGPEPIAAQNNSHLEASSWVSPSVEEGTILGYLTGDMDIALFDTHNVQEISEADALAFAQSIDANAFVTESGVIGTTTTLEMF